MKEHGKKNLAVDFFLKGDHGKKESLGADIEVDSHRNVKISFGKRVKCIERIVEGM